MMPSISKFQWLLVCVLYDFNQGRQDMAMAARIQVILMMKKGASDCNNY